MIEIGAVTLDEHLLWFFISVAVSSRILDKPA